MRSLWALDHALSQRAKHVRKRFKVTATERLVLRILGQSPGTSAGAVASILHILPSTLTPVLQQLVQRNLVRRAADPLDRRRAVLWLTTRGERIDTAGAADVDEKVREALGKIAPSEVFHARRVMSAITEALAEQQEKPGRGSRVRRTRPRAPPRVAPLASREQPVAVPETGTSRREPGR
jgi:DNA-binding MarR family transcriptional regulator